jgi:hypothetical protein
MVAESVYISAKAETELSRSRTKLIQNKALDQDMGIAAQFGAGFPKAGRAPARADA